MSCPLLPQDQGQLAANQRPRSVAFSVVPFLLITFHPRNPLGRRHGLGACACVLMMLSLCGGTVNMRMTPQ